MFGLLYNAYTYVKAKRERRMTIVALGLDNAGKTTLLSTIQGELGKEATPTFGFQKQTLGEGKYIIEVFDLGGGTSMRRTWKSYLAEVHAVMYIVDAADADRFGESKDVLAATLADPHLGAKPILIFANKQDLPIAASPADVATQLGLAGIKSNRYNILPCVARCAEGGTRDARLREGLKWIVSAVDSDYKNLDSRVRADTARARAADAEKKRARDEAVRKRKEERAAAARAEEEAEAAAAMAAAAGVGVVGIKHEQEQQAQAPMLDTVQQPPASDQRGVGWAVENGLLHGRHPHPQLQHHQHQQQQQQQNIRGQELQHHVMVNNVLNDSQGLIAADRSSPHFPAHISGGGSTAGAPLPNQIESPKPASAPFGKPLGFTDLQGAPNINSEGMVTATAVNARRLHVSNSQSGGGVALGRLSGVSSTAPMGSDARPPSAGAIAVAVIAERPGSAILRAAAQPGMAALRSGSQSGAAGYSLGASARLSAKLDAAARDIC